MIGSLRKKFIFVSAASILLVFAGIFSLFAVSTLTQLERTLDTPDRCRRLERRPVPGI